LNKKLKIEYRKPEELTGYENNARVHDGAQIIQIVDSINEFGFTNPILIDENDGIIAGHGRIAAAEMMELKTVPVIVLSGLSDEQKRAYVLADNKLALNARWDETLLALEMSELTMLNFDIGLTGFDETEVSMRIGEGVDDLKKEWTDMPEFEQNSAEAFRTMIMHFPTEADWNEFIKVLAIQKFTQTTKFLWWPEVERDKTNDLRVVSDAGEK
jgi:ParB-like chromosome segregation protein Spo0J